MNPEKILLLAFFSIFRASKVGLISCNLDDSVLLVSKRTGINLRKFDFSPLTSN